MGKDVAAFAGNSNEWKSCAKSRGTNPSWKKWAQLLICFILLIAPLSSSWAEKAEEQGAGVTYEKLLTYGLSSRSDTRVQEKVREIAAACRAAGKTDEVDIALWLHDWLTENANYDYTYTEYGADGVLLRGTGVCQSYTLAYGLLLDQFGIENDRIISESMNHTWNVIKLGDVWYHVDVTWDDPGSGGSENRYYFGRSDESISRDHAWEEPFVYACPKDLEYSLDETTLPDGLETLPGKSEAGFYGTSRLKLLDANGQSYTLSSFTGKRTLFVYGNTYCPNTQAFLHTITPYANILSDVRVVVCLLDDPDAAGINEFAADYSPSFLYTKTDFNLWGTFNLLREEATGSVSLPYIMIKDSMDNYVFYSEGYVMQPARVLSTLLAMPAYETFETAENEDGVTITRYVGFSAQVTIPDYIHSTKVTALGKNLFKENRVLDRIEIPNTVCRIEASAFEGSALGETELPASLAVIGDYAFRNSGIQIMTLHRNVTEIGVGIFDGCNLSGVRVYKNSYADQYMKENYPGVSILYLDSMTADGKVKVDEVNFPDEVFRAYVASEFDRDQDGILSSEEIAQANGVYVRYQHIGSLKGIEFLTEIDTLDCGFNNLTTLDLSLNTKLLALDCQYNLLSALDLSRNTVLRDVLCGGNDLTRLIVNEKIRSLNCAGNQLRSLDVGGCAELLDLSVRENQLTRLDVSRNRKLEVLFCSDNPLNALDLSQNLILRQLQCDGTNLAEVDITNNAYLVEVYRNGWSGEETTDGVTRMNYRTHENVFYSGDSEIVLGLGQTLRVGNAPSMLEGELLLNQTNFPDPAFLRFLLMKSGFDSDGNGTFSEAEIKAVWSISCRQEGIKSLQGIAFFTALTDLNCRENELEELDLSGNPLIENVICVGNKLKTLKVDGCQHLAYLACDQNQLSELDVSAHPELAELYCDNNPMRTLDVRDCPILFVLYCANTSLEEIRIDGCGKLIQAYEEGNWYFNYGNAMILYEKPVLPDADRTLTLPAFVTVIESEGFRGTAFQTVCIAESVKEIQALAFADCAGLKHVFIASDSISIAENAFKNTEGVVIHGKSGSDAEAYAKKNGFTFQAE